MDSTIIIEKGVFIVIIFAITMLMAMYSTLAERKIAAWLQDRIGPNRAGKGGVLQPLADGLKLFSKEEFLPNTPNKFLFVVGPAISMSVALMTSAVIPWGDKLHLFGRDIVLQATDIDVAILYVFGVLSVGVYGIMIGGWASNNKFSLMSAMRAASQMISYEIAMGLSIIALLMMEGTLSLREISANQSGMHWNVFYQPLGFIIFLVCSFAETNRTPFDLAECEAELIGGYHTEYSSMRMGFYLFAEYASMFISSTILAVLYFGGYNYPGMEWAVENWGVNPANIIGIVVLFIKICFFIFFFMWVRWTIPRFRYDQLMRLGWKALIPLAIANIIVTAVVMLLVQ
ncbi:NADH-quinone oxidoreductase subunit NuoH [Flavobacterium lindanitolerans]|jgi:NADH-quinone oxidoreductase subunit H|uniref:NADH-quinone oxidoreductase subunit H n=1 Tax=Flavobacterium lindanitolerans TaxID=428988 RepID=A0A497UXP4_9FLAO|nr:NADH-quinone oxidoreductase subunit NuoH [Flavobacterium lindanitolerans]THD33128.1 MAG: NADH-quinone oxidoreductase subunit NuoH [Flavobacterium johnsoniae]MBC8643592.1 NADH-quinone oxidoreductase subunit NuoH [Flavobacterium lindanitolerans]MDQ7959209.1 NADH-quinone oxidoreductase subunit NuoH [Flavobacterium lindanitolerans]PKW28685.1 NADH dehydrogenase subunit H [Flavobacterium lindanitolerans]RLJ35810.1 NADH-quinone oxidoreductase subunit H [Flavobacterium lindanitolerans]